ncbi:TPA: hypothetical protein KTV36_000717 [Escherichia coli]|nr:hypothetical protein [Escherichia coli]HBH5366169.1 hypothetical protein [Escherichia coli]
MKQMTLIEMDGFLKGKCIPRDLKVNETNAEYLVRKFGELESKLETALRECRSAGITIDNLEVKCAALAAENAELKSSREILAKNTLEACNAIASAGFSHEAIMRGFYASTGNGNKYPKPITTLVDEALLDFQTPATDAFLAEVRAQGVELFAESQKEYVRKNRNELDSMTRAAYCGSAVDAERFAAELRKGGNQ